MTTITDVTVLSRKRGNIRAQITRISNWLADESLVKTENGIKVKIDGVRKLKDRTDDVSNIAYAVLEDKELPEFESTLLEMADDIESLEVSLLKLLLSCNSDVPENSTTNSERSCSNSKIKLPEIPLPQFSGLYTEWLSFKSQFLMLIDRNKQLSDSQKLYYLQSALTGSAKKLQTIDDSYTSLFKALTARYENKRLIVNSHIKELLHFNKLKFESAKELRNLVDSSLSHLRALKQLELESNPLAEALLVNIIIEKIDDESRKQYEMTLSNTEIQSFDSFVSFLQKRCQMLENVHNQDFQPKQKFVKPKSFLIRSNPELSCPLCKQSHVINNCKEFLEMDSKHRYEIVKNHKLCINCLNRSHKVSDCKSKVLCQSCKKKHHSLLHFRKSISDPDISLNKEGQMESKAPVNVNQQPDRALFAGSSIYSSPQKAKHVILQTAIVYFIDAAGNKLSCRALLDNGSMANFMTKNCAQMLNLKTKQVNVSVSALNGSGVQVNSKVTATLSNASGAFQRTLEFFIVPKVSDIHPSQHLDLTNIDLPKNIVLADPQFYRPSKIDVLIGAEIFFELLNLNFFAIENSRLNLHETVFGYVISGSIENSFSNRDSQFCGLVREEQDLNQIVEKFWQLEAVEPVQIKNVETKKCEDIFVDTVERDSEGRYIVKIPLTEDPKCLGESRSISLKRLDSLWKRLSRDSFYLTLYRDFLKEYLNLGHMSEVVEEQEPHPTYYMPHHGVYRPNSSTTKLRVVFNASTTTTAGNSLNSIQLNGGVIQEDLFSIMCRFRKYQFVFTADIEKMFRMILIHPDQRNLQRIVWKDSIDAPVKTYQLNTVTYGTVSAPYLAMRTLKQLAIDEGKYFPQAASVLLNDFYMDDVLTGEDDLEAAKRLQHELVEILERGGMHLHKWFANHPELAFNMNNDFSFALPEETKTLGILWKPRVDCFSFKVELKEDDHLTKRSVLSTIARIFDPLGLLGPVIAKAKIFLQGLWLLKIDWNEALPAEQEQEWKIFVSSLKLISSIEVERKIIVEKATLLEIHGFADASEKAYGTVVYLRSINASGKIFVRVIASKSRVAPMKHTTIPRLELCAAVLMIKFVTKIIASLKLDLNSVHLWSDSTIVLAWIRKDSKDLKTFVAHRVAKIQELSADHQWDHVSSGENPADLISRGVDPERLRNSELWWNGPPFLQELAVHKSRHRSAAEGDELYLREVKDAPSDITCAVAQVQEPIDIIENCSSFFRLQRIVSWCLRFVNNARNPLNRLSGPLTSAELSRAIGCIVKNVQRRYFAEEISCLERQKPIPSSSKLISLCPFIDQNGVLRVGGRLKNSNLTMNEKHQMLVPKNHNLAFIIVNHFHLLYFHAGPESTLYFIRCGFWIVGARNLVRRVLKRCVTCLKVSAHGSQQVMADLPLPRVTAARVFCRVGVDYCGPFIIKEGSYRTRKTKKCYCCLFICMAVKAIHIEVVSDLTTEAFIGALRRFVARRAKPVEMYSDNGKNFVGANNEMRKILKDLFNRESSEKIEDFLAREGIQWHFNPPLAPHFGGLWEAGVKSLKYHLKRIVGNSVLSYEEIFTLVTQIEAVLNSRPLCPLSNNPNDTSALTPGHFITGSSLVALPDPDLKEIPMNRLSRWQMVQKLIQTFWRKWSGEYLSRLQQRPKWCRGKIDFKEGDIVLVRNDSPGPLKWNLARIEQVHPGKDNIVRVVTIKTQTGVYQRSVTKIAKLPHVN